MEWNISNVSSVETINNASLYLYLGAVGVPYVNNTNVSVFSVNSSLLDIDTINWTNQPCGVNFDNNTSCELGINTTTIINLYPGNDYIGWYSFNITEHMKSAKGNSSESLGLALKIREECQMGDGNDILFASSDDASAQKPYIDAYVEYIPVINTITINETYINSAKTINIQSNVTDGDDNLDKVTIDLYNPDSTSNVTNASMGSQIFEYNFTVGALTEGNYTIKVWANDTDNQIVSNTSWFIIDNTQPLLSLSKDTSGDGFILPAQMNLTFNFTELYQNISTFNVSLYYPNLTLQSSYLLPVNSTISINWSLTTQTGNYTINLTLSDFAGNTNSTLVHVGVGKINFSIGNYLAMSNFTTFGASWQAINGANTSMDTRLPVTITADGILAARNRTIALNLSDYYPNWTSIKVHNSTESLYAHTLDDITNISWETELMSTGDSRTFYINISTDNAINLTRITIGSLIYDYMIITDIRKNMSEWAHITLPTTMQFEKDKLHIRYWICISGVTRAGGCSVYSSYTDVTSANNGNNEISGYDVDMKMNDTGATIADIWFRANHTSDFLMEIAVVAGSYSPGTGTTPASPGGGSPTYIIQQVVQNETESPSCPSGYEMKSLLNGTQVCTIRVAKADVFAKEFMNPVFFGVVSYLHLTIAGLLVGSLYANKKYRNKMKKVFGR